MIRCFFHNLTIHHFTAIVWSCATRSNILIRLVDESSRMIQSYTKSNSNGADKAPRQSAWGNGGNNEATPPPQAAAGAGRRGGGNAVGGRRRGGSESMCGAFAHDTMVEAASLPGGGWVLGTY